MNERTNRQRDAHGGDSLLQGIGDSMHVSADQLNALLDEQLPAAERDAIEHHLAGCDACQAQVAELRGMVAMLRALPEPAMRRSFQLGPEHLKSNASLWSRLAGLLLPALPALRATTVAVALLLAAVSIRNVAQDPADRGPVPESGAVAIATEQPPMVAPTYDAGQNTASLPTNQEPPESTLAAQSAFAEPEEASNARTESVDDPAASGAAGGAVDRDAAADEEIASDSAPAAAPSDAFESADEAEAVAVAVAEEPITFGEASIEGDEESDDGAASSSKTQAGDAAEAAAANEIGDTGADGEIAADTAMSGSAGGETDASEDISMAAIVAPASPTVAPSPTSTPTATATPTATPTATLEPSPTLAPSPTATPQPVETASASGGDARDNWEIAQLSLAIALIVLIALSVLASRLRNRRRPHA